MVNSNENFSALSAKWMYHSLTERYSYNFTWMGRPIIQYPQDMIAVQELVFMVQPDLIILAFSTHSKIVLPLLFTWSLLMTFYYRVTSVWDLPGWESILTTEQRMLFEDGYLWKNTFAAAPANRRGFKRKPYFKPECRLEIYTISKFICSRGSRRLLAK